MQLIFISGLSGAGKTVALKQYEDLGFYCIDNMPLDLVAPLLAKALSLDDPRFSRLALGIDARAPASEIAEFPAYFDSLRAQGVEARILFLSASDEVLQRRFSETRRPHPLSCPQRSLSQAIAAERALLAPIANLATMPLDTSRMNLHELRTAVLSHMPDSGDGGLTVQLLSFGFKNGIPDNADFIFDARCLVNPHWIPELRPLSGLDPPVAEYLESQPEIGEWFEDVRGYLMRWLPRFRAQDRSYVTIALGCTGGQHRSVFLVEKLRAALQGHFDPVITQHRELGI